VFGVLDVVMADYGGHGVSLRRVPGGSAGSGREILRFLPVRYAVTPAGITKPLARVGSGCWCRLAATCCVHRFSTP